VITHQRPTPYTRPVHTPEMYWTVHKKRRANDGDEIARFYVWRWDSSSLSVGSAEQRATAIGRFNHTWLTSILRTIHTKPTDLHAVKAKGAMVPYRGLRRCIRRNRRSRNGVSRWRVPSAWAASE